MQNTEVVVFGPNFKPLSFPALNDSYKEDTLAQRGSSFCPLPKICKYFVTLGDHMSSFVDTLDCCSPLIFSTFTTNLSSIIWQCFCHNKLLLSLFDLHFHHLAGACLWFFFFLLVLFYFMFVCHCSLVTTDIHGTMCSCVNNKGQG